MQLNKLLKYAGISLLLLIINLIPVSFLKPVDFTDDRRFSLSTPTLEVLDSLNDVVSVRFLFTGEVPAQLKRLQNSARNMLVEFNKINPNFDYFFENPAEGTPEELKVRQAEMEKDGIVPIRFSIRLKNESKETYIYPFAIFSYGDRYVPVNLLESRNKAADTEDVLNNSISLLEYKYVNAIHKLTQMDKPTVLFTAGHGELAPHETAYLEDLTRPYYDFGRIYLDQYHRIDPEADLIIVAKPTLPFSDKDLFKLDQYLMYGGKVIWYLDALNMELDSLRFRDEFLALPYNLNLEDFFFKQGIRLEPNLVQDIQCSNIDLAVGKQGNREQTQPFPYLYHPIIISNSAHALVKSIGPINLFFAGSLDTVKTKTLINKKIILTTSDVSKVQMAPIRMNFDFLRIQPDPAQFKTPLIPVAVLLEGEFLSFFENRVKPEMEAGLQQLNIPFKSQGVATKMLVVSDGDLIRNHYNQNGQILPLGFNIQEKRKYQGNEDFALNTLNYFLDDAGLFELRNKEVKLRLINKEKARMQKTKYHWINIGIPLVTLLCFGLVFHWLRKKKYAW